MNERRTSKLNKALIGTCCITIAVWLTTSFIDPSRKIQNNPPEVSITEPKENDRFSWNTLIRYNISVKDKEDGDSEFEEIKGSEVLLEALYLPDETSARKYIDKKRNEKENRGLTMIRQSDCFSCHASKSKLIGPSFEMIANKYKSDKGSIERLKKSIINGSAGTWGTVAMPAHPSIGASEGKEIVEWILENGATPGLAYYPGLQGVFKTEPKQNTGGVRKVLVLTASYIDRGDGNSLQNSKSGQHSILLREDD